MTSTVTTIRRGITSSQAVKVPVKAATTANITLSGEQTIDDVALIAGDRVLVKDQTDASENGIYQVDTSAWDREPDWDGSHDVKQGTYVFAAQGTTNNNFWRVSTADPITIGTTDVSFIATDPDSLLRSNLADISAGQGASLVGIQDSAGNFTATTVEGALAEILSNLISTSATKGGALVKLKNGYTLQQTFSKGADLTTSDVTAGALTLGQDGNYFDFTGTDTITSINTIGVDTIIRIHFDDAAKLTHNATGLVLPGSLDINTAAGDEAEFIEYATGDWRCINYQRAAVEPDYHQASWTPTLQDSSFSDAEGQTYAVQTGRYTKIGERVFFSGQMRVTSLGTLTGGDSARIAGLPYNAGSNHGGITVQRAEGLAITATESITGNIASGTARVSLRLWDATTGTNAMTITEFSASGDIYFTGSYTV